MILIVGQDERDACHESFGTPATIVSAQPRVDKRVADIVAEDAKTSPVIGLFFRGVNVA